MAFLAPIAITAVVYICWRYRASVLNSAILRNAVLAFGLAAVVATGAAAGTGALLNKLAPIY